MSALFKRVPMGVLRVAAMAVFGLPRPMRRLIAGPAIRLDGQDMALEAQLILVLHGLLNRERINKTPEEARRALEDATKLISGPTIEPVVVRGLTIDGTIPARLYTPRADTEALLVYFHGGGGVIGSLDTHDNVCRLLAKESGVKVLSVAYRLAPEHPFTDAAADATAAFRHAVANAAHWGVDPERIAVGGDSAGGTLAAVTAHRAVRSGGPRPVFQLLYYPGADATRPGNDSRELFTSSYFLADAGASRSAAHPRDPQIAGLLADDLTGMPPAYISTAGFDPLRGEGEALARGLADAGVPVIARRHADLVHAYVNLIGVGARFREATLEGAAVLRDAVDK